MNGALKTAVGFITRTDLGLFSVFAMERRRMGTERQVQTTAQRFSRRSLQRPKGNADDRSR